TRPSGRTLRSPARPVATSLGLHAATERAERPRLPPWLTASEKALDLWLRSAGLRRRRRRHLSVAEDEQPLAGLRRLIVLGVEYTDVGLVPEPFDLLLPFREAGPRLHPRHVLDDDPTGLEHLGEPDHLEGRSPTDFAAGCVALRDAVAGAFRGGEQQVDLT